MWGEDNEADGPTMSDKARIFGLITSEKYRDEVKILMGKPSSAADNISKRIDRDDPSLSQRHIWNRIKIDFHDQNIVIEHPSTWEDASEVIGYYDVQPNDEKRFHMHMSRDTVSLRKHCLKKSSLYTEMHAKIIERTQERWQNVR